MVEEPCGRTCSVDISASSPLPSALYFFLIMFITSPYLQFLLLVIDGSWFLLHQHRTI